jgi:hypothetical protein
VIRSAEFVPERMIEERAARMLAGFQSRFGKITAPPIPIDKIIERYLDLWFDWDEIDDTDEERILGCLDPATKKIRMNTRRRDQFEQYKGMEAYTKAHEVGHWDMHIFQSGEAQLELPLFASTPPQRYLCRQKTGDPREYQAERYAAYLLMPQDLLLAEVKGLDVPHWPTLYSLRDRFGVSISALTNRLTGLGLLYIAPDGTLCHAEDEYGTKKRLLL